MAKKKVATPQPDSIDVAALAQQKPVENQPAAAVPVALTEQPATIELTEQAAPVTPVVTRGVPQPPTPGLKVQLRQRSTGRIIAMSVDKALAVRLAASNPNLEII